MTHRIVWPIVAVLGLGGLLLILTQTPAQRAPEPRDQPRPPAQPGGPPMPGPGRFVVANASSAQVIILDTVTGQVYRAVEKDFKSVSELPRMPDGPRTRRATKHSGRTVERHAQPAQPEEKFGRDNERPRDRRQPPREDGDRRDPDPKRP